MLKNVCSKKHQVEESSYTIIVVYIDFNPVSQIIQNVLLAIEIWIACYDA